MLLKAWRAALLSLPLQVLTEPSDLVLQAGLTRALGAAVGSGPAAAAAGCSPPSLDFPAESFSLILMAPLLRLHGTPGACGEATQGGKGGTSESLPGGCEALCSLARAEKWRLCSVCVASDLIRV